jgi:hypothetical protein
MKRRRRGRRRRRRRRRKNLQSIFKYWSVNLILICTRTWLILVLCSGLGDIPGCEEVVRGEID